MPRFRRGDAPVTRRPPRGDVQHEPLPLLVSSFASITPLLCFPTSRAATFSDSLLRVFHLEYNLMTPSSELERIWTAGRAHGQPSWSPAACVRSLGKLRDECVGQNT
jgi:hypothetical protein